MDDVAASPRPQAETTRADGRGFTHAFIQAHRQKIYLGLSVAGTLLLGPFAINNFFQERVPLGILTSTFMACLLLNAFAIARGRGPMVPPGVIFVASAFGLGTAMYNNGLIGVLWVYPGILLYHFMLRRRTANLFNATLILLTIPLAWMHLGPEVTLRVTVTLTLLVVFSNIFSGIADAQQLKEVEQRERLDALVRQLEEQNQALRQAFRLREEVERIARHDLKTPLASIASVPRLLRERRRTDPQEDELLAMVERAALRVLNMVNLSLDLFRMEEGTYRLRAQPVDLVALVQTVAGELRAHARSKDLRLLLQVPPRPVYAQGEELLCYSILANLLKNALEASPEGGEVRVTVHSADGADGQRLVLDIHNRGEVPEPVRRSFFEKYATHGKPGGMGLGAYSARLMARVQHGQLRMESGAAGTTLSLRLPQWHGAAPQPAGPDRAVESARSRAPDPPPALSLLLVDDDEYNIVVLKSALPGPALSVRTAVNGRAALECVRAARPDVIFMDVEMPVMGGIEAVERIRALQRERGETPSFVAAFSAHDDEATRRKCLEVGFDLYLSKPASREEVFTVLERGAAGVSAKGVASTAAGAGPAWMDPELADLVPKFLASRRRMARELGDAAAQGDREALRATAHKLAGGLAMYGFTQASRASAEVEQAALSGDLNVLKGQCEALLRLLEEVQPVVRAS